jgi:predicted transcriptional regulator
MDCTQRAHPPIGHELRFDGPMRRIGLYDLGTKGTNSK